jgi:trimeric autotransporter adhesin
VRNLRLPALSTLAGALALPLAAQTITTIAGNGRPGSGPDGVAATASPLLLNEGVPGTVAFDRDGNLYFPESGAHRVRKIGGKSGTITTVAGRGTPGFSGDGGPATDARLNEPSDLAFDADGNLLVADASNNRVRRVDRKTGVIETVWGNGRAVSGKDGLPAKETAVGHPTGLAVDARGDIFVVDSFGSCILRLDAASGLSRRIAGNGTYNFDLDATNAANAGLPVPSQIRLTSDGDLVVTVTSSHAIVRLNPATGAMKRIAGNGMPGNTGDGGSAREARIEQPAALAVDRGDNVWFVDWGSSSVRRVDAKTGVIETRVGSTRVDRRGDTKTEGFSGDGGPATKAQLWHPSGLGFDKDGNLYVLDAHNSRIRRVEKAAP